MKSAFNFKNRLSALEQSRGKGETPLHIVVAYVDPSGNETNDGYIRSEFKHPQTGRPIIVDWPNDSPTPSSC